ncbi:MAG: RNA-binding protein, partial [Deltaproteobacteria bacterium]|nr:RNA-binding protein [Deltaproteobacteria bacterium]
MSRNVYVGNLPYRISDDEVREIFAQDGREVVSVNLIIDRETGKPRGFGFVEFADEAQAEAAVQALDGANIGGRPLKVNIARPREGGGGGYGGG